jgi:hypothetical protein
MIKESSRIIVFLSCRINEDETPWLNSRTGRDDGDANLWVDDGLEPGSRSERVRRLYADLIIQELLHTKRCVRRVLILNDYFVRGYCYFTKGVSSLMLLSFDQSLWL